MATKEVAMTYTQAAVERAMKVHEVLMQALNGRQPWIHVAEVLGVSARTVRRLRARYEKHGFTGLYDHRHHRPSPPGRAAARGAAAAAASRASRASRVARGLRATVSFTRAGMAAS